MGESSVEQTAEKQNPLICGTLRIRNERNDNKIVEIRDSRPGVSRPTVSFGHILLCEFDEHKPAASVSDSDESTFPISNFKDDIIKEEENEEKEEEEEYEVTSSCMALKRCSDIVAKYYSSMERNHFSIF